MVELRNFSTLLIVISLSFYHRLFKYLPFGAPILLVVKYYFNMHFVVYSLIQSEQSQKYIKRWLTHTLKARVSTSGSLSCQMKYTPLANERLF